MQQHKKRTAQHLPEEGHHHRLLRLRTETRCNQCSREPSPNHNSNGFGKNVGELLDEAIFLCLDCFYASP
jgi:hypothetical protein